MPFRRHCAKMREGDRERIPKLASGASGAVEGVDTAQTNFLPLPPRDPSAMRSPYGFRLRPAAVILERSEESRQGYAQDDRGGGFRQNKARACALASFMKGIFYKEDKIAVSCHSAHEIVASFIFDVIFTFGKVFIVRNNDGKAQTA